MRDRIFLDAWRDSPRGILVCTRGGRGAPVVPMGRTPDPNPGPAPKPPYCLSALMRSSASDFIFGDKPALNDSAFS